MSYILWRGTHGCCQPGSQPALLPELAAQLFLSLSSCSYSAIQVKLPKFSPALAAWPSSPWHDMAFQRKQEYGTRRLHFPADTCPVELAGSQCIWTPLAACFIPSPADQYKGQLLLLLWDDVFAQVKEVCAAGWQAKHCHWSPRVTTWDHFRVVLFCGFFSEFLLAVNFDFDLYRKHM